MKRLWEEVNPEVSKESTNISNSADLQVSQASQSFSKGILTEDWHIEPKSEENQNKDLLEAQKLPEHFSIFGMLKDLSKTAVMLGFGSLVKKGVSTVGKFLPGEWWLKYGINLAEDLAYVAGLYGAGKVLFKDQDIPELVASFVGWEKGFDIGEKVFKGAEFRLLKSFGKVTAGAIGSALVETGYGTLIEHKPFNLYQEIKNEITANWVLNGVAEVGSLYFKGLGKAIKFTGEQVAKANPELAEAMTRKVSAFFNKMTPSFLLRFMAKTSTGLNFLSNYANIVIKKELEDFRTKYEKPLMHWADVMDLTRIDEAGGSVINPNYFKKHVANFLLKKEEGEAVPYLFFEFIRDPDVPKHPFYKKVIPKLENRLGISYQELKNRLMEEYPLLFNHPENYLYKLQKQSFDYLREKGLFDGKAYKFVKRVSEIMTPEEFLNFRKTYEYLNEIDKVKKDLQKEIDTLKSQLVTAVTKDNKKLIEIKLQELKEKESRLNELLKEIREKRKDFIATRKRLNEIAKKSGFKNIDEYLNSEVGKNYVTPHEAKLAFDKQREVVNEAYLPRTLLDKKYIKDFQNRYNLSDTNFAKDLEEFYEFTDYMFRATMPTKELKKREYRFFIDYIFSKEFPEHDIFPLLKPGVHFENVVTAKYTYAPFFHRLLDFLKKNVDSPESKIFVEVMRKHYRVPAVASKALTDDYLQAFHNIDNLFVHKNLLDTIVQLKWFATGMEGRALYSPYVQKISPLMKINTLLKSTALLFGIIHYKSLASAALATGFRGALKEAASKLFKPYEGVLEDQKQLLWRIYKKLEEDKIEVPLTIGNIIDENRFWKTWQALEESDSTLKKLAGISLKVMNEWEKSLWHKFFTTLALKSIHDVLYNPEFTKTEKIMMLEKLNSLYGGNPEWFVITPESRAMIKLIAFAPDWYLTIFKHFKGFVENHPLFEDFFKKIFFYHYLWADYYSRKLYGERVVQRFMQTLNPLDLVSVPVYSYKNGRLSVKRLSPIGFEIEGMEFVGFLPLLDAFYKAKVYSNWNPFFIFKNVFLEWGKFLTGKMSAFLRTFVDLANFFYRAKDYDVKSIDSLKDVLASVPWTVLPAPIFVTKLALLENEIISGTRARFDPLEMVILSSVGTKYFTEGTVGDILARKFLKPFKNDPDYVKRLSADLELVVRLKNLAYSLGMAPKPASLKGIYETLATGIINHKYLRDLDKLAKTIIMYKQGGQPLEAVEELYNETLRKMYEDLKGTYYGVAMKADPNLWKYLVQVFNRKLAMELKKEAPSLLK